MVVLGGLGRRTNSQRARSRGLGRDGPAVLHISGERDYASLRPRVARPDYVLLAHTDRFGDALAAADLAVSRAGGTVWGSRSPVCLPCWCPYPHATADHQTLNARWFERGGGALVVADGEPRPVCPGSSRSCSPTARGSRRCAEAMLALARPDAADEIAEELIRACRSPLSLGRPRGRLYFVGIGGSGLSAYANISRAWGAEVRGWEAGETLFLETLDGVEVDLGGEPRPPGGYEVVVSAAHRDRAEAGRGPTSSRSSSACGGRSSSGARTGRRRRRR